LPDNDNKRSHGSKRADKEAIVVPGSMRLGRRNFIKLLACAPAVSCAPAAIGRQKRAEFDQIVLRPGHDIQQAIDSHPEGTNFVLTPGIYRQQSFTPKNRQRFVGQTGAILNGALQLTQWRFDGAFWRHDDLPKPLQAMPVGPRSQMEPEHKRP